MAFGDHKQFCQCIGTDNRISAQVRTKSPPIGNQQCGCLGTRRMTWGGLADTQNRLSSRCQSVVWFLMLWPGAVLSPFRFLPEAFPNCRTSGLKSRVPPMNNLISSHNFTPAGRWFELSCVYGRAQDVFPQLPKAAALAQFIDMEWINPSG